MSTISTATVETLVAEVRVLMVGSRQITLSVARQLDWDKLEAIEPFGRVRLDAPRDEVAIIGRSRFDGTLVLAKLNHPGTLYIDKLSSKITVCESLIGWARQHSHMYVSNLKYAGTTFDISREYVQSCGISGHDVYSNTKCDGWKTNELDAEIVEKVTVWRQRKARYEAAVALPLIVLAGLR